MEEDRDNRLKENRAFMQSLQPRARAGREHIIYNFKKTLLLLLEFVQFAMKSK